MSLTTINQAARDPDLRVRVEACAHQEAENNPNLADSDYAKALGAAIATIDVLLWPVAVATEAAYEAALLNGRGAPGHDEDVITDAQITASVQAAWPPNPWPPRPSV